MSTTTLTRNQRSVIFTRYNRLRAVDNVERGRLNRALGLAQTGEERPYETTADGCTCPDYIYRMAEAGQPCKHMIALTLGPEDEGQPASEAVEDLSLDEANGLLFG